MPESAELTQDRPHRELMWILAAWLVLAALTVLFAKQNLSVPGLYYDEAKFLCTWTGKTRSPSIRSGSDPGRSAFGRSRSVSDVPGRAILLIDLVRLVLTILRIQGIA